MKRNNFIYKTYCELGILSDVISPDYITDELKIIPTRSFKKGDTTISKRSGSIITKPHNLWVYQSQSTVKEDEVISHHIENFVSVFFPKIDILKKYKENPQMEVTFWIWIETDNAGIGLDLEEQELGFLHSLTNKIHFSIICTNDG